MDKPPFEFGQTIYYAYANSHYSKRVPCDICYGQKEVTLILGNGDECRVGCEACGLGFQQSTGTMTTWGVHSEVIEQVVSDICRHGSDWEFNHHRVSEGDIFATKEEAEERRKVLHAEAEEHAKRMYENNRLRSKAKHAWSASYHRNCIRDAERNLAYHRGRFTLIKDRDTKKKKETANA